MALMTALTLSLPARARVYGMISHAPATGPSATGQTGFKSGGLPAPAQVPLCHVRCRGFVASVPAPAPHQYQSGPAVLDMVVAHLPPAATEVLARAAVTSSPGASPPRFTVLRL